jgi:two-component system, NarL family, response regulator NreC
MSAAPTHLHLVRAAGSGHECGPVGVVLTGTRLPLRRSLRQLIEAEADMKVVADCGDLAEGMRLVHEWHPDVLVLDLQLVGNPRTDAIRMIRARAPETEIIALTMQAAPGFAAALREAGAVGYVLKDQADVDLAAAIRAVGRGETYVSPSVTRSAEPEGFPSGT